MKTIRSSKVILATVILVCTFTTNFAIASVELCECYDLDKEQFYMESAFEIKMLMNGMEFASANGQVFVRSSTFVVGDRYARTLNQTLPECHNFEALSSSKNSASEDYIWGDAPGALAEIFPWEHCSSIGTCARAAAEASCGYATVYGESGMNILSETYSGGAYDPACITSSSTIGYAMANYFTISVSEFAFSSVAPDANVLVLLYLRKDVQIYVSDCNGAVIPYEGHVDLRTANLISYGAIRIDWLMEDGTTQSTVLQGVMADIFDGAENHAVSLGIIETEGLGGEGSHFASISIPVPDGQVVGATVSAVLDNFEEFDGDINNDGLICADDRVLMLDLVYSGSQIGDGHYLARADFDLNGVINNLDLDVFNAIFDALPDCNNNDNPDACDIARGISEDTNSNGMPDECEVPRNGACCLEDGSCTVTDVEKCGDYGGSYHGNGTDCSDPSICIPYGACCYTDYICKMDSMPDCELYGGTFQGDGSDCSTPYICGMLGACCFGDDSCDELTEDDCLQAGGTYLADGSDCSDPSICPPIAACCVTEDTCKMVSSDLCQVYGGDYHGYGSDCSDPFICDPLGACCFKDETCDELTEYDCHQAGGTYLGEGSDCSDPHICDIKGACCLPDGSGCKVMTENECIKNKGRWDGDPECTDKTCNVQVIFLGNTKPK